MVVSLSPHLVETQSSEMEHSSRWYSDVRCERTPSQPRRPADGLEVPVLLDGELGDRFAGFADAVGDALGPARLDADDHNGSDVGVGASADHGPEMQFQIFTELQTAIGMRDGQRALDIVGNSLTGGVGDVVDGQNDNVVADPDPAVFAPVSLHRHVGVFGRHFGRLLTSAWFCNCGCGRGRPLGCRQ